jgi:hypothetical protein
VSSRVWTVYFQKHDYLVFEKHHGIIERTQGLD